LPVKWTDVVLMSVPIGALASRPVVPGENPLINLTLRENSNRTARRPGRPVQNFTPSS